MDASLLIELAVDRGSGVGSEDGRLQLVRINLFGEPHRRVDVLKGVVVDAQDDRGDDAYAVFPAGFRGRSYVFHALSLVDAVQRLLIERFDAHQHTGEVSFLEQAEKFLVFCQVSPPEEEGFVELKVFADDAPQDFLSPILIRSEIVIFEIHGNRRMSCGRRQTRNGR